MNEPSRKKAQKSQNIKPESKLIFVTFVPFCGKYLSRAVQDVVGDAA